MSGRIQSDWDLDARVIVWSCNPKDFVTHHELMSSENNALLDDRGLIFRF
jgi:hypothetical protein